MFLNSICYGFQFTRYLNTDAPGSDVTTFSSDTIDNCEAKCLQLVYCKGFVYQNSTNFCWTKYQMINPGYSGGINAIDAYYRPPSSTPSQIILSTPNIVKGNFDTQLQNIIISGSEFGVFTNSSNQYIQIEYLDTANSTLFSHSRASNFWNNTSIQLQYPQLGELKYYNMYAPTSINVTVFNSVAFVSFNVKVKYPTNFGVEVSQGPFKCYFGKDAIKTDPFTRYIHMYSGEELKMNIQKPNGFPLNMVAIQKLNESSYLNSNRAGDQGHRFGDRNAFTQLETGYLFINTTLGFLIYNNGFYLGYDNNVYSYHHDISSFDISDNRVVFWNCTNNILDSPSTSPSSFQTNLNTFDVDLLTIDIYGNSFGAFGNFFVNYVDFEIIKNGVVILTDSRNADSWTSTNISIAYPKLNDLRFFYGFKPDSVNIVVHTAINTMTLQINVRIPLLNTTNPFKCYHPDGRIWKNDNSAIRLNTGSNIEILADNANGIIPNDGEQIGLRENATGEYLRHSSDIMYSNGAGGLIEDFVYFPMVTNKGFIFHNMYQYYRRRYIGYISDIDELHTCLPGHSIFTFWNCNIKYSYKSYYTVVSKTTAVTSKVQTSQTTTVSTLKGTISTTSKIFTLNQLDTTTSPKSTLLTSYVSTKTTATSIATTPNSLFAVSSSISLYLELPPALIPNITVSSHSTDINVTATVSNSTNDVMYLTIGPSEDIYIGIEPLSIVRESISLIFMLAVIRILIRRYIVMHGHGKRNQNAQRTFNYDSQ